MPVTYKVCARAGCGSRTSAKYCDAHKLQASRDKNERHGSRQARGYGVRHTRWRAMILARDPVCVHCQRRTSTVADHILSITDGGTWSLRNGQGLCARCHGVKTVRHDAGFVGRQKARGR